MRTRSSRLFIVLIHVIGVTTTVPGEKRTKTSKDINKYAVILEKLILSEHGLDSLVRKSMEDGLGSDLFSQPFWIQDQVDGFCLTPYGFSECGDASLWYIRPDTPQRKRSWRRRQRIRESSSYGLEYINVNGGKSECLLASRKRVLKENAPTPFGSCESQFDRAFGWHINGRGVLHNFKSKKSRNSMMAQCLWRHNLTSSTLGHCMPSSYNNVADGRRLAKLSLIRHVSAAAAAKKAEKLMISRSNSTRLSFLGEKDLLVSENKTADVETKLQTQVTRLRDKAHSQASSPVHSNKLNTPQKIRKTVGGLTSSKRKESATEKKPLLKLEATTSSIFRKNSETSDMSPKIPSTISKKRSDTNDGALKLRRLETHPYIAAAKDEIWTDPQTGLRFPTDLCRYLGDDLKTTGRHTLTGMGYYTRTIMNIKIYGVGMYVSKRDILADPPFQKYASLSAEELRFNPEFYTHLRNMPSDEDPTTGFFDRTIFIKINMQLSVATMQSSLRATWKLLTEEAKNLLIGSSGRPRPAEAQMLELIRSPENPNRCSCSQIAPPEYESDPTCCARGTELVFTWRKNGDLEIRLDGRVMDIFQRPDVAKGIFYEYLRIDDPMTTEFLENVVDGFPFLLGPLSKAKGMPLTMNSNDSQQKEGNKLPTGFGKFGNFVNTMTSHASSHADEFVDWVQTGANNAGNAARTFGDAAKGVAEEFDRRRDHFFKQMSMLPENGLNFVRKRIARRRQDELATTVSHYFQRHNRGEILMKEKGNSDGTPHGRIFQSSVNRFLGLSHSNDSLALLATTDDYEGSVLGGIFFFTMVHLYLLLILIVSLPDTNQTRLMRRSKGKYVAETIGTDEESSSESSSYSDDAAFPSSTSGWMIEGDPLVDTLECS